MKHPPLTVTAQAKKSVPKVSGLTQLINSFEQWKFRFIEGRYDGRLI
jgi:hypothetical protein